MKRLITLVCVPTDQYILHGLSTVYLHCYFINNRFKKVEPLLPFL